MRIALIVSVCLLTVSCSRNGSSDDFRKLADEAVNRILSFSPVGASGQGLHKYNGEDLDRELDDPSSHSIQRQRNYYADLHKRLEGFDKDALKPEDRADYDILEYQIGLALFDIDIAQSWRHSPQSFVEMVGTALFNPLVLEYAPKEERFRHIIARLEKVPNFIEIERRQLSGVPSIWASVAKAENDGNIDLIDHTLRDAAPVELKSAYDTAAAAALDALRLFNRFLETDLPRRGGATADWRLGADRYATKFRLALATDRSPDQVLADAEKRVGEVRARMLEISLPLHAKWFAAHGDHAELKGEERENRIVKEILDHIAQDHSKPASYFDDARKDLDEARAFVQTKNLLTLPEGKNLKVIPTPVFERGIYGVGGFNPAPVLEPQLGAFFWITPIPSDWPKERVESKLREYNVYNLRLLVIHEAMPGHYVQGEFANDVQPKTRRVLRSIFGNGPYVEGWAQYVTQVMLDEGFLDNSPELRLTLLKQELRVDANAIMDIRLQTNRMTDEQAMDLMENSTFQEHEEAVAKLQRAKLSSTQLPTYFVGWRDWLRVREVAKSAGNFNLHDFHDRALKEGAVPLPVLARLLTGKSL
ncbi:MAG TPA: DUF885 domain-containing protein [Bryobacteraceae bacterium]|nr:DUF885 domain-containing protein [Bryobacteraceae bacterium]